MLQLVSRRSLALVLAVAPVSTALSTSATASDAVPSNPPPMLNLTQLSSLFQNAQFAINRSPTGQPLTALPIDAPPAGGLHSACRRRDDRSATVRE